MNASAPPVISLQGVSKRYRLNNSARHRLRDLLLGRRGGEHWALKDLSLNVARGETVGIIGGNGAGKSTLLSLVAGAATPTYGTVATHGTVAALLELGAGFHPDWTGRQNAEFHMRLSGASRRGALALVEAVEDFADIGGYFDEPLRTCSSGMAMRVAFAAAVAIEPDVIVVDEALAVGDASFQHKCFKRLAEFRDRGVTTLLVTHRLDLVAQICDRALFLESGDLLFDGSPGQAVDRYVRRLMATNQSMNMPAAGALEYRMGSGEARIEAAEARALDGAETLSFGSGDKVSFTIRIGFRDTIGRPVLGFSIRSVENVILYSVSTEMLGCPLAPASPGDVRTVRIECELPLPRGHVFADFTIADFAGGEFRILDARLSLLKLEIRSQRSTIGLLDLGATFSIATN